MGYDLIEMPPQSNEMRYESRTHPAAQQRTKMDGPVLTVKDGHLLLTEGGRVRRVKPRWQGTSLVLGCTTITADALGKIMRFVSYGGRDGEG
jgi:hypothetical protein